MAFLNLPRFIPLAQHNRLTIGKITEIEPENHNSITYEYSVRGKTYVGGDSRANEFPKGIGKKLQVYYDTENPGSSSSTDPNYLVSNELSCVFLIIIVFPGLILVPEWIKRRKASKGKWSWGQ